MNLGPSNRDRGAQRAGVALDREHDSSALFAAQLSARLREAHSFGGDAVDRGDEVVLLHTRLIGWAVRDDVLDGNVLRFVVDLDDDAGSTEIATVEPLIESGKVLGRQEHGVPVVD